MALLFDGSDDKILTSGTTGWPVVPPLTVACMVRLTDIPAGFYTFFSIGVVHSPDNTPGWVFEVRNSGAFQFFSTSQDEKVVTSGTIPATTWIIIAYSGTNSTSHRLFAYNFETKANILDETFSTLVTMDSGTPFTVGKIGVYEDSVGVYLEFLSGTMAWIAMFGADLSSTELTKLATLGPYGSIYSPTAVYGFNEMTGSTVKDLQASGNDGTMSNFPGSPWSIVQQPSYAPPDRLAHRPLMNQLTPFTWKNISF